MTAEGGGIVIVPFDDGTFFNDETGFAQPAIDTAAVGTPAIGSGRGWSG